MLGNTVVFKLGRIVSDAKLMELHFANRNLYGSAANNPKQEPWQLVMLLTNLPPQINFTQDELTFLIGLENFDVFNSVCILDQKHSALLEMVGAYTTQRQLLMGKIKPISSNHDVGTYRFTESELLSVRPNMVAVNSIAEQNLVIARKLFEESQSGLEKIHKFLKDKLGLKYNLQIADESEAQRMHAESINA